MKKKLVMIVLLNIVLLSACNDMQQSKPATSSTTKYTATSVFLIGKVEAKSGNVEAIDSNQNIIALAAVQNGRYQLEIPAQTQLPLVLRCEQFVAVVIDTDLTSYDINALTTAIAEKAKALGGYTRQNMVVAASNSVNVPDANKTSTGFRGDPTSQYGGWH